MSLKTVTSAVALSCALALSAACDRANTDNRADDPNGNPGVAGGASDAHDRASTAAAETVSITGCIQEGRGINEYILTEVNKPAASASGDPSVVAREQTRAAARAYRLDAERNHNLAELVGKQVSITGKIEDRGNFVGTSGNNEPRRDGNDKVSAVATKAKGELDSGDLAAVKVLSVTKTADACK
jgi:hypothetical protein